MDYLGTAVAFAVIMMVFSTIVAVIVESAHMVFRLREKGLRRFMEVVYQDIVRPRFSQTPDGTSLTAFVEVMTRSRFRPVDKSASATRKLVARIVNAGELKNLGTTQFIERLTELPEGKHLIDSLGRLGTPDLDAFLKDLARRYEEWGASATEYFARRAKLVSVIIAILLAFALNLNAIDMFRTLLTHEALRGKVIERGDEIARIPQQPAQSGTPAAESAGQHADRSTQHLGEVRVGMDVLRAGGIPFGWETVPWKGTVWQSGGGPMKAWLLIEWAGAVLLTGLLIGLGGPFWFDAFRKLSTLTSPGPTIRGPRVRPRKESETPPEDRSAYTKVVETVARSREVTMSMDGERERRHDYP